MARDINTISIRIEGDNSDAKAKLADTDRDIARLGASAKALGDRFTGWGKALLPVSATISAIGVGIIALGKRGAEISDVAEQFNLLSKRANETAGTMLGALRDGTLGTIANFDLMKITNRAMGDGLRISAADMKTTAQGAKLLADRVGGDTVDALGTLTLAMATGRTQGLKTLGLYVDQEAAIGKYAQGLGVASNKLNDQQKIAAIQGATLAELGKQIKEAGGVSADFADKLAGIGVRAGNMKDRLAESIANSKTFREVVDLAVGAANRLIDGLEGMFEWGGKVIKVFEDLPAPVRIAVEVAAGIAAISAPTLLAIGFGYQAVAAGIAAVGVASAGTKIGLAAVVGSLSGPVAIALAGVGAAFVAAKVRMDNFRETQDHIREASNAPMRLSLVDGTKAVMDFSWATKGLVVNLDGVVETGKKTSTVVGTIAKSAKTLGQTLQGVTARAESFFDSIRVGNDDLTQFGQTLPGVTAEVRSFFDGFAARNDLQFLPSGGEIVQGFFDGITARMDDIRSTGRRISDGLKSGFMAGIEGLGDIVVGAIQGGGDVGRAMGASIGRSIGADLAKNILGESTSKLLKGALSFLGPLGALAGGAIGGLVGKVFGGNDTKKGREQFAGDMGYSSLAAMYDDLRGMGAKGASLVHEGLNVIGKRDTVANQAWIQSVKDLLDTQGKTAEAARAMIPDWESAGQLADKYGISLEALGPKFKQGGLSAAAQDIYTDFERLAAFIGEDMNEGVLRGMSDEISALVKQALSFGGEIPKQMQPMIQKLIEMGLLVDENGNKLEGVENLKFGETMQDTTKKLIDVMKELAATIRDSVGGALSDVAQKALHGVRIPVYTYDGGSSGPSNGGGPPTSHAWRGGYVTPQGVQYMDTGGWVKRGTDTVRAMLTPGEFVVSRKGVAALSALNDGRVGGGMSREKVEQKIVVQIGENTVLDTVIYGLKPRLKLLGVR